MSCNAIFKLAPNRVWRTYLGGRTLDGLEGKTQPEDSHFPEDWILSGTRAVNAGREEFKEEGISKVEAEPASLNYWLEKFPVEILGEKHFKTYGANPGFLLKFLDSSVRLHIQCHPTAEFSQQHLGVNYGKTEGYYILGIRPGCEGYIYLGFQRSPGYEDFRQAIVTQDVENLTGYFDRIKVRPGDCFIVPGGIPHAIGEGVFMIEMMEPSDLAVRIEFERGGYVLPESARFMNRDVDFALSMFDFRPRTLPETKAEFFIKPLPLPATGAERYALFDTRYTGCFRAERWKLHEESTVIHQDGFYVLIVTGGTGYAGDIKLKQYDRILVPACTKELPVSGQGLEFILALPPCCD